MKSDRTPMRRCDSGRGTLKGFAKRWRGLGHSLQWAALLSWTLLSPAIASYAPDANWQPVWSDPNTTEESGPDFSDYDSDGVPAWLEAFKGTSDWHFDTDYDGIGDYDEIRTTGTSPTNWDSNGNGISDLHDYYGYYSGGDGGGGTTDPGSSGDPSTSGDPTTDPSGGDTPPPPSDPTTTDPNPSTEPPGSPLNPIEDTDGDGLMNQEEQGPLGTDPLNPDTDGDGLTDGFEVQISGTSPTNPDSNGNGFTDFQDYYAPPPSEWTDDDMDGLSNEQESSLGTSSTTWDTDGDGLSDYEEVNIFSSHPLDPHSLSLGRGWGTLYNDWQLADLTDSDGGGIPDRVEQHYGMNPSDSTDDLYGDLDSDGVSNVQQYQAGMDLRANIVQTYDRDGDGMTDVWELEHGLNPDDASDMGDDPDGDWITNLEEFRLGTEPSTVADDFATLMQRPLPQSLSRATGNQGLADWDGDGMNNNEELGLGMDPRSSTTGSVGEGGPVVISATDTVAETGGGPAVEAVGEGTETVETGTDATGSGSVERTKTEDDWWDHIPLVGDLVDFFGEVIDAFDAVDDYAERFENYDPNTDSPEDLSRGLQEAIEEVADAAHAGTDVGGTSIDGPQRKPGT